MYDSVGESAIMIPSEILWSSIVISLFIATGDSKPHIIILLADDLGWNDVGFHGSNQIPTPNIDALAYTGVILNNYYVTPICTPTRAALLTGKYPIHTGLQHQVIGGSTPYGLSTKERILPEYLKNNGYITRAIGKWHLGHFKKEYTPEYRGFDSHYGYWLGRQDYYDHSSLDRNNYWGYDLKRGLNSTWHDYASYSTDLFTAEAVKIIKEHNVSQPLFLYVAYQAVHSGNEYNSLQAPPEAIAKFLHIQNKERRKFAGMLSKLDDSVGEIVSMLSEKGMLNDSIIIFSTDNGGPSAGFDNNAASNWPLRGVKATHWEGGIKGAGLIWNPKLPAGIISNDMMHVTDWLPTLLDGIKANASLNNIDGLSLWESFSRGKASPRNEILINIDPVEEYSGLIHKSWKLIKGRTRGGRWDKWYGPSGKNGTYDWNALRNSKTVNGIKKIKPLPEKKVIEKLRQKLSIKCGMLGYLEPQDEKTDIFLFNLLEDPCEINNLAHKQPSTVYNMDKILTHYRKSMVKPRNQPSDPRSHPKYWGYQWINWMDYL